MISDQGEFEFKAEVAQEVEEAAETVETVTSLTRRIKECLERRVSPCWVKGEISNLRAQSSGHVYFCLKDGGAQISTVIFRGDAARLETPLCDGQAVILYGEISVYAARGQYQLVARIVQQGGAGRLQQEFEKVKRRLSDEGLFAADRKRPLPDLPRTIGFVTSPTGAAVQDFLRILARRGWRGRVVVLPVRVQGEGACREIAAMLAAAESLEIFDLLVVGRGGGSLEDLWAFNEEPLVRAVAACRVPVISAVGHEIDFTLCDFAADVRAETPSAAAELVSSRFLACLERAVSVAERLESALERWLETGEGRLERARGRLRLLSPTQFLEQSWLRLDDLTHRLRGLADARLREPRHRLEALRIGLECRSPAARIENDRLRLVALRRRLQSASPDSVLGRGYALVRDADGQPLVSVEEISAKKTFSLQMKDGVLFAQISGSSSS